MTLNGAAYGWGVESSMPVVAEGGKFRLMLGSFGPFAVKRVNISFVGKGNGPDNKNMPEAYPLTKAPSLELIALAEKFAGLSYQEKIHAVYKWMVGNIRFTGIDRQVEGATYALSFKAGDCTEHMLLAGELLARNGVSVRRVLGFLLPGENGRLTANALHNWLEVYDGGRWRVLDSSYQFYGDTNSAGQYLGVHHYVDEQDLHYQLFMSSDDRLRILMN